VRNLGDDADAALFGLLATVVKKTPLNPGAIYEKALTAAGAKETSVRRLFTVAPIEHYASHWPQVNWPPDE
jgi:hypothetical protein